MSEQYREIIEEAQQRLEILSAGAGGITTPAEAEVFQAEVQAQVDIIAEAAEAWRRDSLSEHGLTEPPHTGGVLVQLTPRQQARVKEETGESLTQMVLPGEARVWLASMPSVVPQQLDRYFLAEAHRRAGRRQARRDLEAMLDEMAATDNEELRAEIERLRSDPDFADGILHEES